VNRNPTSISINMNLYPNLISVDRNGSWRNIDISLGFINVKRKLME